MNFTVWKGELEIYEQHSCLGDDEESIFHIWHTEKDKLAFLIRDDYKLTEEDDGYGRKIYVIEKRKENGN